jgi:proteasome alpha subunit
MKDRSDYARKGIARGRSVICSEYADGIVFVAENPSATLHKLSEIYDRIAFAGVGKYSEFEELRIGGVRMADQRGYFYGREDVTAKTLANAYSQALSGIFTQSMKPYEVEILIAEAGEEPERNEIYHVLFDGSVNDEQGTVAIGGHAEDLNQRLTDLHDPNWALADAVKTAAEALASVGEREAIPASQIEAAVLDRSRKPRRKFRRLTEPEVAELLN